MKSQSWTTRQLVHFSDSMGNVLGGELHSVTSGDKNNSWTTERLVNMSRALARGYHPGL